MTADLNSQLTFASLVVGSANRLAVTAARAVAESPGAAYNPLFIYASPGLGKTHLLTAIGHAARDINPALAVDYLTLDEFVEAFHAAVGAGQGDAYRRRFLDYGMLLVDDVQFLSQRREMQAELLRVIDALQAVGRQIVLTSDRPPAEIESLDERLIRRFGGGLVIDVAAPDYETRVAILRRRAEERGVQFDPGVLEAVGELEIDNVRELIGALHRLVAFQSVSDEPLAPVEAKKLVASAMRNGRGSGRARQPEAAPVPLPEAVAVDEFADFLQEVSATVSQQVESWRARISEAVLRWSGEGYRTAQLEGLIDSEPVRDPERDLREFEAAVERLRALQREVEELAPDLAGLPELRDPSDVEAAERLVERARQGAAPPPGPSPLWTLDDLIESAANRVVVGAVRAVAHDPGRKYNPLVITGASGNGKTHLLHALGNALAGRGLAVGCVAGHEFVDELISAIERGTVALWRARFRRADVLLIDDVHAVGGKERSQEELFVLFNHMMEAGRQMVFTTSVSLSDLRDMEPRLLTRLEGGLVVEIPAPDRELRQRAVERQLSAKLDVVDPELAAYIAGRPADSMRAALGLVQRVLNAAEAKQTVPSVAVARETLEGSPRHARRAAPARTSGVLVPSGAGLRSREKMVWEWPDATSRIIEEWR